MSIIPLLCKKMPLSCMVRGLLERCFSAKCLDDLFARHAKEQYTRHLLFSTVCDLLLGVVLRVHPSAHAAYQAKYEEMSASATALYDKLKGVESGVSAALVRETARDLSEVQDALELTLPSLLPGYLVRLLDGNCLAASEKRLNVHQGVSSAALPGKSLVVMDPQRRLLVDVFPCEDGHAQERSLFDQVIPTMKPGELWIADRNFCTRKFLAGNRLQGAAVLVRQHSKLPFQEISPWKEATTGEEGQRVYEQIIEVEGCRYRRIRVELKQATRDGDRQLYLITDVSDDVEAATLAALYRKRWRLETAFQQLEAHLESEIQTLGYPRAALLGFCLALVAYNIFSIALSALDSAYQEPVSETLSTYYIGHEIASTFLALLLLTDTADWRFLAKLSPQEFAKWLRSVAQQVNLKKYKKHPRGVKKTQQKIPYDPKNPHVSTYQLLKRSNEKHSASVMSTP